MLNNAKRMKQRTSGAILTEQEVARIKMNAGKGMTAREMAQAYGVALDTIRKILRGDSWVWVKAEEEGMPLPEETPEMVRDIEASQARLLAMLKEQGLDQPKQSPLDRMMEEVQEIKDKENRVNRQISDLCKKE